MGMWIWLHFLCYSVCKWIYSDMLEKNRNKSNVVFDFRRKQEREAGADTEWGWERNRDIHITTVS